MEDLNKSLNKKEGALQNPLEKAVSQAASSLNKETVRLLVGDDEWDIDEFDAKVDASLFHTPRDAQTLRQMLDVLTKIKELETGDDPSKEETIKNLGEEFFKL